MINIISSEKLQGREQGQGAENREVLASALCNTQDLLPLWASQQPSILSLLNISTDTVLLKNTTEPDLLLWCTPSDSGP